MTDREKVIYSIERCICHVPDACRDCAYDAGHPYNECVELLLKDVLSLLKAQEPRVMTIEEVRKHYALPPVVPDDLQWQAEYLSNIAPLYFEYKQANSSPSVHWRGQREAQHCLTHWAKVYGSLWRCWTSRPTDEQREAAKWDE